MKPQSDLWAAMALIVFLTASAFLICCVPFNKAVKQDEWARTEHRVFYESIAKSRSQRAFVSLMSITPDDFVLGGKRFTIRESWIEDAREMTQEGEVLNIGRLRYCITLSQGGEYITNNEYTFFYSSEENLGSFGSPTSRPKVSGQLLITWISGPRNDMTKYLTLSSLQEGSKLKQRLELSYTVKPKKQ